MSYNTNDIMGYAQDPIVFSNEQGGNELYEKVKEVMVYGINENGLPATMFEDTIKSGGIMRGIRRDSGTIPSEWR